MTVRPSGPPIGLRLSGTARQVSRAFDDALAQAGGSTPAWQVLVSLKSRKLGNQRELAEAMGIQGATLTHHLNTMERDGLLTRRRDPDNRRVHVVELTEEGERLFHRLREVVTAFDRQLRAGLGEEELAAFERVLARLLENSRQR
ncbi:MarR family winged helix-turn-helix transcriptional regulator [Nonomuraea spiralis]|uniref:MarR family winged helix-turn-helix transcriptional regulator n=1 Tax=Nonomuraea spiralis TaxID=46182 RepID=A0ABV5ITT0_9ACTN|nr:MarR family winged helix-turn-helix transcriptional regulator [Nonomuraea spiralis]GGT46435.1 transcriptional regulator [Nonomuraea spiralis]